MNSLAFYRYWGDYCCKIGAKCSGGHIDPPDKFARILEEDYQKKTTRRKEK